MTDSLRIPQQPPFRFVDRLVQYYPDGAVSEYRVPVGGLLQEQGALSSAAVMENIAQTCAAWLGHSSETVKIGMIGAVRHMKVERFPAEGELLTTYVHVAQQVFNMTLVTAEVCIGDEQIASADMKIAITE